MGRYVSKQRERQCTKKFVERVLALKAIYRNCNEIMGVYLSHVACG